MKSRIKLFKILADKLYKFLENNIKFDHCMIICNDKNQIIAISPEDNKEIVFKMDNSNSIVKIVNDTGLPVIINHITDSYIYNTNIDNPFNFKFESLSAVPCFLNKKNYIFGSVFLYRERKTDSPANIFLKDELEKLNSLLEKFFEENYNLVDELGLIDNESVNITSSEDTFQNKIDKSNEFFSSIIHDIRTPMNAVMGFLELLEEEASPEQEEYIRAAHKSGEMVIALINDVLDFNKISTGKLDIDLHFFSPIEELENTALLFYHSALKKKIDFITYFDPNIPYAIKSDPYRLKQIVNNLLSNAIKFTPDEGFVILELLYHPEDDTLEVNVKDTGIGIPKEAQNDIFKAFQQASKSTSGKYGGTGLGLSISKQLAVLLGGDLTVESTPNKGSTFTLRIPCHSIPGTPRFLDIKRDKFPYIYLIEGDKSRGMYIKYYSRYFDALNLPYEIVSPQKLLEDGNLASNSTLIGIRLNYDNDVTKEIIKKYHKYFIILEAPLSFNRQTLPDDIKLLEMPVFPQKLFDAILDSHKSKKKEDKEKKNLITNKNVLLVDDNLINLKLMREVTSRLGATPFTASDGKEAIEIFKKEPIDLILIDQNMPVLSGIEAIRIIRSLPKGKSIPIYGLTGTSEDETLKEMIEAGANAILTKPIQLDKLRSVLLK